VWGRFRFPRPRLGTYVELAETGRPGGRSGDVFAGGLDAAADAVEVDDIGVGIRRRGNYRLLLLLELGVACDGRFGVTAVGLVADVGPLSRALSFELIANLGYSSLTWPS
jgi:hypothetical protein